MKALEYFGVPLIVLAVLAKLGSFIGLSSVGLLLGFLFAWFYWTQDPQ